MARLCRLLRRALPSMEREWSRLLQGQTNTCEHILVLQVIPLDVIDYLIVAFLIIIIIIVSVHPSLPRLQLSLPLLHLVLLRLPQPLALGMIRHPHGRIPRQWSRLIHEDEVPRLVPPLSMLVSRGQDIN